MPSMDVHITPFKTPSKPNVPRTVGQGGAAKRSPTGLNDRDLNQWLADVDPSQGLLSPKPVITRSGRTSRTPSRYDATRYEEVRKEMRDLAKARSHSMIEAEKSKNSQASPANEDIPVLPSSRPSSSQKEKPSSHKTTGKDSQKSDPFQRSNKMARD